MKFIRSKLTKINHLYYEYTFEHPQRIIFLLSLLGKPNVVIDNQVFYLFHPAESESITLAIYTLPGFAGQIFCGGEERDDCLLPTLEKLTFRNWVETGQI